MLSICGGLHLARASAWIAIVSVLASFDIAKAKDDTGKEIDVPESYSEGLVLYVDPSLVIVPSHGAY